MTSPVPAASLVAEHAASRPATLGSGRLICIDGPSGSGKTTLAEQLRALTGATVLHADQLCPGWDGLPAVADILSSLLAPLAEDRAGSYLAWDWIGEQPGDEVVVEPVAQLVIEGVGAGALVLARWTTTLVWMDAAIDLRRTRALDRDAYFGDHWESWAGAEKAYFATELVADRADLCFRTG